MSSNSSDRLASRIMIGLIAGLVLGILARFAVGAVPAIDPGLKWFANKVCDPLGQVFLRLLFFVVVPLVFCSLALGVVQLGRLDRLGPLAARTFGLFALNMAIGVALGLFMMNFVNPGAALDAGLRDRMLAEFGQRSQELKAVAAARTAITPGTLVEMFMPRNLLKSVVEFEVLPLIVFALLVGGAGTTLTEERRIGMQRALETACELMTSIVRFALNLAPFAVPALIFSVVVRFGVEFLQALLLFVVGVLVVMVIHLFGTMSLMIKFLGKRSPLAFFKAIRSVMITAFSTSSSNATLPASIEVSRDVLHISPPTAGFVLPLGATMNMSGTALYEGCVVLFIAQVFGVPLSISQQITLLVLSVLSAVAVAGVPGGSLPLLVGLLATFGIPSEGIALILGVDRLLDMSRTVLNVSADIATACIVDQYTPAVAETVEVQALTAQVSS